jgi:hypothetical protein
MPRNVVNLLEHAKSCRVLADDITNHENNTPFHLQTTKVPAFMLHADCYLLDMRIIQSYYVTWSVVAQRKQVIQADGRKGGGLEKASYKLPIAQPGNGT